jgi:drug/metabolite transporter (DMT)-like permease
MRMGNRYARQCLLAACLFGASTPLAAALVDDVGPLRLAGLLYLGAAVVVLPTTFRRPPTRQAARDSWIPVALAVVVGGAVGPALLTIGLANSEAVSASLLLNLELVATVALATLFFGEHLHRNVVVGAAFISVGGVLLVWQPGVPFAWGSLLVVGATICWGFDNCVTAKLDLVRPEHVVFAKGCIAGVTNLALGIAIGEPFSASAPQIGAALAIGAFGYGVSITLWVRGAQGLGAARAQAIFATAPFIGAGVGALLLDVQLRPAHAVAALLAAAGVTIALRSSHAHDHDHDLQEHTHEHSHDDLHHDHDHDHDHDGDPHDGDHDHDLGPADRHSHAHVHQPVVHAHSHLPDLHHRHLH